ncbi:MAG: hypothetical protein KC441_19955 [Anaerolineales bacterium]|nr:hypothetical protein [Anaerolineales bacterium]
MRTLGIELLVLVIIFMIGAGVAAYFRKFPHDSPREQLQLIANDRWGWTAQAIIFPVVFAATAVLFLIMARQLPAGWPRWLGLVAAGLFALGFLLWMPISIRRMRYWSRAVTLLENYDSELPVDVNIGGRTFWPHTVSVLLAIAFMGSALAVGGTLPILGWIVGILAMGGLLVGTLLWHDWPPFINYLLLLILAIGLILS